MRRCKARRKMRQEGICAIVSAQELIGVEPRKIMGKTSADVEMAFIFGAGASMPPLKSQQDLVLDLLEETREPRVQAARKYLRRTFPGFLRVGSGKPPFRFEDIVGPLEIAEAEEYWYHFGGHHPNTKTLVTNREVLDSLDSWVAIALDPDSIPKPTGRGDPQHDLKRTAFCNYYAPSSGASLPYARLVNLLKEIGILERAAFLSMNYDILLDRVLVASEAFVPDYRIDAFYEQEGETTTQKSSVCLLKLHGLLNWRACERCHVLRNLGIFMVWPNSNCVDCESKNARPMLIRPTLLKDFRHRVWKDVWREAGHVLAGARTWVIVGYSLPMADVWMLRLLAQSARSAGIRWSERKIIIVNRDADTWERFAIIFPNAQFREQTFDDWISFCQEIKGVE